MSWESIGDTGTGQMPHDRGWILWSLELAKKYVWLVSGAPPPGSKLEVMWHEHELGEYPSLGVWSEYEPPWDYIHSCERALEVFNDAVAWSELKEHLYAADEEADEEDGEDSDESDEGDEDEDFGAGGEGEP